MELTILIIIIFAVFGLIDYKSLTAEKDKKALVIYFVLFAVSFCVVFLYSMGIYLPGPTRTMINIITAIIGKQ